MTELYIDKQPVVLPDNFTLDIVQENPFFTKNGTYTYDLTLSLKNEQNAKLYKHLNRINNKIAVPQNRNAYMIVDNEVILNGTEIILEITDDSVKIQLVSGESELNYFIGGNKKINELDLGSVDDDPSYTPGIPEIQSFSEAKVLWIPVYSTNEKKVINQYVVFQEGDQYFHHVRKFLPQPYLYHIVQKIITNLGYQINFNILATDSKFKYLYIVNGVHTKKYNKMLPDWTVEEFFSEMEKLFNIAFLADETNKKMNIVLKKDFYLNSQKIYIKDVLNKYSKKIDDNMKDDYSNANIGYELPADEYFLFQSIDKAIINRANKQNSINYNAIKNLINNATDKNSLKNILYDSLNSKTEYICYKGIKDPDYNPVDYYYPKKVNVFKPLMNNPDSKDINISFKITPAAMMPFRFELLSYREDSPEGVSIYDVLVRVYPQIPKIETSDYTLVDEPYPMSYINGNYYFYFDDSNTYYDQDNITFLDIQEAIVDKDKKPQMFSPSGIQLAFYSGQYDVYENTLYTYYSGKHAKYPISYVDRLWDFLPDEEKVIDPSLPVSLRLDSDIGMKSLYNSSIHIDTTNEYIFNFIYNKKLDVRKVFVINNKKFVCKQLKQKVTVNEFNKLIEGIFYPID